MPVSAQPISRALDLLDLAEQGAFTRLVADLTNAYNLAARYAATNELLETISGYETTRQTGVSSSAFSQAETGRKRLTMPSD